MKGRMTLILASLCVSVLGTPIWGSTDASIRSIALEHPFELGGDAKELVGKEYVMRSADGRAFQCRVEHHPRKDEEEELERAELGDGDEEKVAEEEKLDDGLPPDELARRLELLKGQVVMLRTGWWTYEVEIGQRVSQLHMDEKTGHVETRLSLGLYRGTEYRERASLAQSGLGELGAVYAGTQDFEDGDVCGSDDQKRSSHVRFKCCAGTATGGPKLVTVQEPSECMYELTICTPRACATNEAVHSGSTAVSNQGRARGMLDSMQGSCFLMHQGWWSYELCVGKSVRQFHVERVLRFGNKDGKKKKSKKSRKSKKRKTKKARRGKVEEEDEEDEDVVEGDEEVEGEEAEEDEEGEKWVEEMTTQQYDLGSYDPRSGRTWDERDTIRDALGEFLPPRPLRAVADEPGLVASMDAWTKGGSNDLSLEEEEEEEEDGEASGGGYLEEWYTMGAICELEDGSIPSDHSHIPSRRRTRVKYVCPRQAQSDQGPLFLSRDDSSSSSSASSPTKKNTPSALAPLAKASPVSGLLSAREVRTCEYEFIVLAPSLCAHPMLKPRRQAPPARINCQEIRDDQQIPDEIGGWMEPRTSQDPARTFPSNPQAPGTLSWITDPLYDP